ncbi:MAG: SOS response-associated peptidase [Alphaproteobacteria bacterium]|nr:SOS response-associated peptidase [Alphaproteobacteria bacterium]
MILKNLRRDFELGFDVHETDLPMEARPRYNIAPTQMVSVIRMVDGVRRHSLVRWGLIPHWSKEVRKPQINARGETVFEKPMFRDAARRRRCLILADGFYEWKRDQNDKPLQAYFIERVDGKPFAMAGIWDTWISPDGEVIDSVAIVTTEANAEIAPIHDRMPVILAQKDYLTWIEAERATVDEAKALIKPAPDGTFAPKAVTNRANAVRNDDPANLEPADPNAPPPPPKRSDPRQGDLF